MRGQDILRIGRRLYSEGLISGNFGNISIREREGFSIKRTGAYLDDPGTLVFVPFSGEGPLDASRESPVHRTIYLRTQHQAIVHAHPLYAVVASLSTDEVVPLDCEGRMLCPRIPVVQGEPGTEDLGLRVADALTTAAVVIA
ncbi:MAG TPA: class II aldolase/adducin family protein, partial [Methanomicrobiales archaeon]|nr:class II aldolase/adducin family protein [Methanomicrobiales archaeon]